MLYIILYFVPFSEPYDRYFSTPIRKHIFETHDFYGDSHLCYNNLKC